MTESQQRLLRAASEARDRAHAPYSGFRVGAALLCASGRVITGGNVENASLGLSVCAERTAVFRALAEGEREFQALAIVADGQAPTPPCGACRQVLQEFAPGLELVLGGHEAPAGPIRCTRLADLLPEPFVDFRTGRGDSPADGGGDAP